MSADERAAENVISAAIDVWGAEMTSVLDGRGAVMIEGEPPMVSLTAVRRIGGKRRVFTLVLAVENEGAYE